MWIYKVLEELKMTLELPLKLYCDSKAAISIAHNPVQHDRMKHIKNDHHFIIQEKLDAGIIYLSFGLSNQQTTNILTKSLARPIYIRALDKQIGHDKHLCTNLRGVEKRERIVAIKQFFL